jgi:hypothetical protein
MNSSPGLLLRYRRSIQPNAYICLYIIYISHMEHMVWLKNEAGSGYLHNFDGFSKFCPFKLPLSWSKSIIFGHTHIIYHMVGDRSQDIVPRLRVPWESRVTPWEKKHRILPSICRNWRVSHGEIGIQKECDVSIVLTKKWSKFGCPMAFKARQWCQITSISVAW